MLPIFSGIRFGRLDTQTHLDLAQIAGSTNKQWELSSIYFTITPAFSSCQSRVSHCLLPYSFSFSTRESFRRGLGLIYKHERVGSWHVET